MDTNRMIQVKGLSRDYGSFTAVDNVSFEIGKGEIVALLGHNGAGKTTIMKMLTGYLEPSAGTIVIGGADISGQRREVQKMIGYLPENCPLYPEMSVIDYLFYHADLHGISEPARSSLVRDALRRAELIERSGQSIDTLSRGYRQRVGVARAILARSPVLILDEPTNGLDPTQILQMRELIRESAGESTVILSTHILQEAEALCDRVLIIRNGALVVDTRLDQDVSGEALIIATDCDEETLSGLLEPLETVERIALLDAAPGRFRYLVECRDGAADEILPRINRVLVEAGVGVFELATRGHDLEVLFRNAQSDSGGHRRADRVSGQARDQEQAGA